MTVYELKELCKQKKIRGYGGKNKDSLIALLSPVEPQEEIKPQEIKLQEIQPEEVQSPEIKIEEIQQQQVEPEDPFDMSGPFIYVFERSSHLELIHTSSDDSLLHLVDTTRPHFLVLENVKKLVKDENGSTYKELKAELEKRGYFHRYRILDTLEKNVRLYVVCLRKGEDYEDLTYHREKAEEASISIIINPSINMKYIYSKENSSWIKIRYEKDSTVYSYIRMHILKDMGEKVGPRIESSGDLTLRQCFNFDNYP